VFSVAVAVLFLFGSALSLSFPFESLPGNTFTHKHTSPFTSPMARLSDKYEFLIPMHPEVASSPRRAVQLVDAPIGRDARFVYDPTGAVTAFLSKNTKPLKVIGVAGTFR
jgi:hypothetical protein